MLEKQLKGLRARAPPSEVDRTPHSPRWPARPAAALRTLRSAYLDLRMRMPRAHTAQFQSCAGSRCPSVPPSAASLRVPVYDAERTS